MFFRGSKGLSLQEQGASTTSNATSEPEELFKGKRQPRSSVRTCLKWTCLSITCAALFLVAFAAYAIYWWWMFVDWKDHAPDTLEIRHVEVPIHGLHPALNGLKIAQITDLHFNNGNSMELGVTEAMLRASIAAVNAAEPDLIVATGDFQDHWQTTGILADKWLSQLRSRSGAPLLASLGNHDFQKPGSQETVTRGLRSIGATVLVNEAVLPLPNEEQRPWLEVVGLGDFWTAAYRPQDVLGPRPTAHPETAVEQRRRTWHYVQPHFTTDTSVVKHVDHLPPPPETGEDAGYRRARIVLSHNPDTVAELATWPDNDVVLAGHTHGGLSCFPPVATWMVQLIHAWVPTEALMRLPIPGIAAVRHFAHTYGLSAVTDALLPAPPGSTADSVLGAAGGSAASAASLRGGRPLAVYTSAGLTRGHPARWLCNAEVVVFTLRPVST